MEMREMEMVPPEKVSKYESLYESVISRIALSGVFNQISRIVIMNKGYEMSRYKMANWYISFITFSK